MSMFNLAIGTSGYPPMLMGIPGLHPTMIGRYRDHWLERNGDSEDSLILALYTRNGGGNREEYAEQLDEMHSLPSFISDADDEFDSTYCTLRFLFTREQAITWLDAHRREDVEQTIEPEEAWDDLLGVAEPLPRDMSLIWRAILQTMEGGVNNDE